MNLRARIGPYLRFVLANPVYQYEAIAADDILRLSDFDDVPEIHDRLIAIAAERLGATILTKDALIRSSARVKSIWRWFQISTLLTERVVSHFQHQNRVVCIRPARSIILDCAPDDRDIRLRLVAGRNGERLLKLTKAPAPVELRRRLNQAQSDDSVPIADAGGILPHGRSILHRDEATDQLRRNAFRDRSDRYEVVIVFDSQSQRMDIAC